MRAELKAYMAKRVACYRQWFVDDREWAMYLDDLLKPTTWGDGLAIAAACDKNAVPILVLLPNGPPQIFGRKFRTVQAGCVEVHW